MRKTRTHEELKAIRPRRGKRIISEKHERKLNGERVEQESFLNDVTVNDESMGDVSSRPATMDDINAAIMRNKAERRAEYASMGRTGREKLGDLPPIGYKFPVRDDVTSESEGESDKENSYMDESMGRVEIVGQEEKVTDEKEEEMEKEEETTPVGQQRKTGMAGPSESSTTPANPPVPSTPPARPNSGFKKPNLPPGMRGPPRHSTPKANVRPRESFGAAFNNISIIANNSMQAPPSTVNDSNTRMRKESTRSRGPPTLHVDSIEEEEVLDQPAEEVELPNRTYDVQGGGEMGGEGMDEDGEERQEDQSVRVHIEAVVMRRASSVAPRDATMVSIDGMEEEEERVEERVVVMGVAMRREPTVRPPHPPAEEAMRMPVEGRRREEEKEASDEDVEDEEMASVYSPARNPVMRPAKRPSLEHPLNDTSSPMAVMMARRSSGLRNTMVRPKVSIAPGRKISTGSVASTIPFEDLSRSNLSVHSSDGSYEEAKTPVRTPRADRLLRQSLAARDQRQRVMPILEEGEAQGGEMDNEEEDDDDDMEIVRQRHSVAPTTPLNRLPRLSQRLQSSVDRLSQPRHRHDQNQPCAKMISPARVVPVQRGRLPQPPSPSPARRFHTTLNQTTRATMSGYTPNHRIDTTLMEDDEANRKSGLALRIKRNPLRDVGRKARAAVLDVSEEQSDLEEMRRARNPAVAGLAVADGIPSKNTSVSGMSHRTATPIGSPTTVNVSYDGFGWVGDRLVDDDEDDRREDEEEEEEDEDDMREEDDNEREEDEDDGREESQDDDFHNDYSMGSNRSDDVFVRPAPPLPSTPKSAHGRRNAATGAAVRSMRSDSDVPDDMEGLAKRASEISMDDEEEEEEEAVVRRPAPARGAAHVAAVAAEINDLFNSPDRPATPKTPFRAAIARNADLFSTDTPGIDPRSMMDTEEEEEWAANQDSVLWRGNQSTEEDENLADPTEDSQIDIVEEEDASERVLAPRKLIAPTGTPGVRRSTRTRMKPVRGWLGETAQYQVSPTTGNRRLVGVNEVTIREKIFVQTGTADIQAAVMAKKKTAKQRGIANKKRREQKEKGLAEFDEDDE